MPRRLSRASACASSFLDLRQRPENITRAVPCRTFAPTALAPIAPRKARKPKDAADTMGLPGVKDRANGTSARWILESPVDGTAPANLTVTGLAKALPRSWAPQTGLRHTSNRSRACRNGNWKMASRDWRCNATSPHLTFQNLPARDSGAPA
jgi:hypothetical protein